MNRAIRDLRRFSILAAIATYFVIFAGGLVRVSGAGLGCPDWPKCFGRWIPPTSVSQLPSDIDPSLFNFTLAWIEYINRLLGVLTGIFIVIVAVLAIKNFRKMPKIIIPSVLAAILVAIQGWHGGRVVASELEPLFVSVHMVIAFVIVSLLVYLSREAYCLEHPEMEKGGACPGKIKTWAGLLWLFVIVQVLIGSQVRASIETVAQKFPLLSESEWLGKIGGIGHYHAILGVIIVLLAFYRSFKTIREVGERSQLLRQASLAIMGLLAAQLAIGIVLFLAGIPAVMQVLHLWIASLITGFTLISYCTLKHKAEA